MIAVEKTAIWHILTFMRYRTYLTYKKTKTYTNPTEIQKSLDHLKLTHLMKWQGCDSTIMTVLWLMVQKKLISNSDHVVPMQIIPFHPLSDDIM